MRKAMLAGAVALALTGTGAALAWSATGTPTPSPSPSQSAPGKDAAPGQHLKAPGHMKGQRMQPLHGEGVVKKPDGTFQTILEQRGTVESVSDTAITVRSEDGYSQTYTVNGDTRILVIPAPAGGSGSTGGSGATGDDGRRLKPTDGTIADIAAGDTVRIAGVRDGGKAAATRIVKGAGDGPGLGRGHERGPDHGKGMGKGHNQGA